MRLEGFKCAYIPTRQGGSRRDRPWSPSLGRKPGAICPFHCSCLLHSSSWGLIAFPQASIQWPSSIHRSLKRPGLLESTDHSSLEISPPFMSSPPVRYTWRGPAPSDEALHGHLRPDPAERGRSHVCAIKSVFWSIFFFFWLPKLICSEQMCV